MTNYEKLIETLKEVFMLDKAELDFGIYRIMNQKRKEIDQFLEKDLVPQVKTILSESLSIDKQGIQKQLNDAIQQLTKLKVDPETSEEVRSLRRQIGETANMEAIENEVFSLLTNFFKRYFDSGDFISMRRYKKDVYAIPYEGEEIKLHWANSDQYYIKTSEYFKNYRFKLPNAKTVGFELVEVSTELNNNIIQGDKERRFAVRVEKPCEEVNGELRIYFTFEPTDRKIKQDELLVQAFDLIKGKISQDFIELLNLRPTEKDRERTLLQKHLSDYATRNTFDYFIHKDLDGFLKRELDFYIKNEVLFVDDLNTRDEQEFLKQLSKIKAIKKVGEKIISFLAQLEDFQKRLWLKKKFVVECNYCITLDRVSSNLYEEICSNERQTEEWIRLYAINEIKAQKADNLFAGDRIGYSKPLSVEFIKQNQYLLLDTALFSDMFKMKLIGGIEKFDEQCDGVLINSDNFQGLNTIQNRYRSEISYCYFDPPYNTSEFSFVYKNNYKHSSWVSMILDRVSLSKGLLTDQGVIGVAIDDTEIANLRLVMDSVYGIQNYLGSIAVEVNPAGQNIRPNVPARSHDYLVLYERVTNGSKLLTRELTEDEKAAYEFEDKKGKYLWDNLRRRGGNSRPTDRPNQWFPLYVDPIEKKVYAHQVKGSIETFPIDPKGERRIWRVNPASAKREIESGEIAVIEKAGRLEIVKKSRMPIGKKPKTLWADGRYSATSHGSKLLNSILGGNFFSYPKSLYLVEDSLMYYLDTDGIVLDIFAGSATTGHAVINLNRSDDGNRKYVLIEMGSYFDSVTKPRIQKIVYSKEWKDGKPVGRDGISQCFKYMRLESYEDTLNNLTFRQTEAQQQALGINPSFKEGYMLNYFLDVEAKNSLLNLEWFFNPFKCYLNITKNNEIFATKIDLIETFNYLIGLIVENYSAPKPGYVVVTGKTLLGERILIVWRDCSMHDSKAVNTFLQKSKYNPLDGEFDRIYVNGDNNVENLKIGDERWKVGLTEEEFKRKMFETN